MKTVSLSGSLRENVGKKDAKKLRKEGLVPCVLLGAGEEMEFDCGKGRKHLTYKGKQLRFYTDAKNFKHILFTPETFVIDFNIDGKVYHTILQEVQYHPVNDEVLHADFLAINEEKPITVLLPVRTEGTSPGVMRGGKLNHNISKLKVSGFVNDLPDSIILDISKLNLNQSIKVKDLDIPNVTPMIAPNTIIVDVKMARVASVSEELEDD